MPELPEVETVVRDLRPHLIGKRFAGVQVGPLPLRRRWEAGGEQRLLGRRIQEVERRGKWILLTLGKDLHLVFHLGMTGQLTVVPSGEPLLPHTHLVLTLNRGHQQLRFRDIRRFGSASVFGPRTEVEHFFQEAGLGPEPFHLDPKYWRRRLAGTHRNLKAILLDQRVLAGVGNIYADEALFEARLHPARPGKDLNPEEADRLRRAVSTVLRRAIHKRGSSIRNYVGGSGLKGSYQREFRVYGRSGQPCPRCGRPIQRIRLAGRSTHFCPQCQPK
ncbi:MAG: bifunctional DNA-formamidopyrimidine glycosylase/DNA-(apurinic or apyrimidinic site) lyase [Planctomycetes bacterium]|nr:bifunctional DNA-formamidopyrimidine glycosylase/DNA-(apurinic or apyrimidinic site) lyase [Planctomycetota bacterium]